MTVDISALAWIVRRLDVSATFKTFVAVFAILLVLYNLIAIYQFVLIALHDDFGIVESGSAGWLIAGIVTLVVAAFGPLAFIVWDWVARRPWRYLAAFNGALLGAIAMAAIGAAIGALGNEIFENLESFALAERIVFAALLGIPLAIMLVLLFAESKSIQVAMKWLLIAMAGAVLAGLVYYFGEDLSSDVEDLSSDSPGGLSESLLALLALVFYVAVPAWLIVRVIRHRIILSSDLPRELFLGALHRKGFWVRLAFLTGLPSSLWHAAAMKTPAFWAFLLARPIVYGGFLLLLRNVNQETGSAGGIAAAAALIVGGHVLFYAAKRLATRYAWIPENPSDRRAPVLFLRSFEDDQLRFSRRWWDLTGHWVDLWSFRRNADEAMIDEIAQYGPVVALGMPGEKKVPFGAQRYYSTHEDWQNIVSNTARSARAIVIAAGNTPGVLWEYELLGREKLLDRTLLLFPVVQREDTGGNAAALAAFANTVGMDKQFELTAGQQMIAMIPAANGMPALLTAGKATAAAYVVAIRGYFQKCTMAQLSDPLSL